MPHATRLLASVLLSAALCLPSAGAAGLDHSDFDTVLRAHVRDGRVDYEAFARSREFAAYLDRLASASLSGSSREERLAFWLNAYNAWTIRQVIAHGRPASIRDVRTAADGSPVKDAWSEPMVRAAGRVLTLDQVEHEIIRREFAEPRVHFALVCAALGCPPLRPEAYSATLLEAQLEDQARRFLAGSPEKNRVDVSARRVHVSPVLVWYRDDFGGSDAAIGRFLARYWPAGPEQQLLASGGFELEPTEYDWRLNGVGARR